MSAPPAPAARVAPAALEDLLRRAVEACRAPAGWISFLEGGGERLAAAHGIALAQLPPERSFALQGGLRNGPLFLEDALAEARWRAHPLVASGPRARMVAVMPVREAERLVGTLTVIDPLPRRLGRSERTALANLAALAGARLETQQAAAAPPDGMGERLEAELRRRREAEAALQAEREIVEVLLGNLGGAFFLAADDGTLMRWNAAFAAAVGHDAAALGAMRLDAFITPADRPLVQDALREVLEEGREAAIEAEVVDRAGNVRPYLVTGRPVSVGGRRCVLGMARDITVRRRNEQQMARAKERLDLALAGSRLALWDWDLGTRRVYFNENWSKLRGEAPCEATFPMEEVLEWPHPDDRDLLRAALGNASKGVSDEVDCEWRIADAEGEWIWVHWRGRVMQREPGGTAVRVTGTATNATQRKRAEERAEWLATRDALTGLPNRVLLHDRLEQAVANAARHHTGFAFMFIDLDRFKTINDSLGHHVGDELLKEVAKRLSTCVRASDTVARLGGDEFAVLLENLRDDDHEGAGAVAQKMVASLAAPLVVEGQPLGTSCSVGVSLYPGDGRDSATLMKNADVAMYHAKEKGRNNYQFFSSDMNARAQERLSVENYLRLAIRRGELVLHFQPRKRVADGALVGAEALVRWQHPRRGLIGPDRFMDVAEESGLIVQVGEWVLENACAQLAAWQRLAPDFRLSVNLSLRHAGNGDRLDESLAHALAASGAAAAGLELELTEAHLMQDAAQKVVLLNRLARAGVALAIDDFGTGYSSLAVLKRLPVDAIKVDGSFVRDIESEGNDRVIVQAILAMAHALGVKVVAEGVETPAQLARLRELGCDHYQGYLECPPVPAAQFQRAYLEGRDAPRG